QNHGEKVFYRSAEVKLCRLIHIVRQTYEHLTEQKDIKGIHNQRKNISYNCIQQPCLCNNQKVNGDDCLCRHNQQHNDNQKPLVTEWKLDFCQRISCKSIYHNT